MRKVLPLVLVVMGALTLVSVAGPIGWQQLNYLIQPKLLDPTQVSGHPAVLAASIFSGGVDYTDSETWFPANPHTTTLSKVRYYSLSVPTLQITNIPVEINGIDLKKNAIQYSGTAVPGSSGNTVVFGHSTLPQLSREGNPLSVFTSLPKIRKGDEVVINYDGVTYRYRVRETMEVKPTQIEVLAQRYDKYELTLITCVPLGTYLHRFVARAELVN